MSQLEFHGRPWVEFDPSNSEHRFWYYMFVDSGTWRNCPYRFNVSDDQGDLPSMIERKLLLWYTKCEFNDTSS